MSKRKFYLEFVGSATIELDDAVIDAVDDEWRESLYNLHTPEEIAEMVGRCMVCMHWPLSQLDGWADQPNSNARIIQDANWETVEVREITKGDK